MKIGGVVNGFGTCRRMRYNANREESGEMVVMTKTFHSVHFPLAVALVQISLALPLVAQQESAPVQFTTFDKVELHGSFYPCPKGKEAPCVILLTKFGSDREKANWKELASSLQADYAVLSFDFRGHGESTDVNPQFWQVANNFLIKGAGRMPTHINFKDFPFAYLPVLANDISAAKRYLDERNDLGACNSSNVILIGAEEGAAIAALWIASEFQHPHYTKNAFGTWSVDPQRPLEGEDIAAGVWLSMPRTLSNVFVGNFLRGRVREKVPMAFFYGDKDYKSSQAAQAILTLLNQSSREKMDQTRPRAVPTKLAGTDLLKSDFDTIKDINKYLTNVMERRGKRVAIERKINEGPSLTAIPLHLYGFYQLQ
jgi:hypothetical protein